MKKTIIAPSILSLDFSKVSEQLSALNQSEAKWVHFDVMDGNFVPNITFGPDLLKGFKKCLHQLMDVHIMVKDPMFYAPIFIDAGADILTFHYEAFDNIEACIECAKLIHSKNCKAGISIKPKTDINVILPYIKYFDLVLIMGVEPGFGGQMFMDNSLDKIKALKAVIERDKLALLVEVDGGINIESAAKVVSAGCDVLVAGSFIFKQDIISGVEQLLCVKS